MAEKSQIIWLSINYLVKNAHNPRNSLSRYRGHLFQDIFKFVTVPNFCHFTLFSLWMPYAPFGPSLVFASYSVLILSRFSMNFPAGIWCKNDVVLTSMRRHYVASTLTRRHFDTKCPLGWISSSCSSSECHCHIGK